MIWSKLTDHTSEVTLIVVGAIIANLLTPAIKRLWRSAVRYGRRHYLWRDSTQRIIRNRRNWRKTSNTRKVTHRLISAIANLLDIEFIEWREAINENNARLHRKSTFTKRWERHSLANIQECLVDPSYNQFLELLMDEDLARFSAENKPLGNALIKWAEKDRREFAEYKREYNEHIKVAFVDNTERYESVLHWGFMSNHPPVIAAKVYEEKSLSFPEDFHKHCEGGRSYDFGHINEFINKKFPERQRS